MIPLNSNLFVRFRYALPKEVLANGKHELIIDPSDTYFGVRMQKRIEFTKRTLVTSARSQEKARLQEAQERFKEKLANQYLDEEAKFAYCQQYMEEMNRKKAIQEAELKAAASKENEKDECSSSSGMEEDPK